MSAPVQTGHTFLSLLPLAHPSFDASPPASPPTSATVPPLSSVDAALGLPLEVEPLAPIEPARAASIPADTHSFLKLGS